MYTGSKRGIISQFERYSLYLSFEPEAWRELISQVKPSVYRRGEIIRPGGDTSARITIMLSGAAQVGTVLQSGRGIVTHIIGPGAVWGMPSTYADDITQPTRTSLTAMSDCEVCHVPRHVLLQWVEKDRRKTELICTQKALPVQKRGRGLQQEFAERLMMGLSDEDQKKLAIYFSQMEKNLDQIIKGDER